MSAEKLNVISIFDPEPIFRFGLKKALGGHNISEHGEEVIGDLTPPTCELALVGRFPSLLDTLTLIRGFKREQIPVIAIVGSQDDVYLKGVARIGVQGLIQRSDTLEIVTDAVRSVSKHGEYVSPGLSPTRLMSIIGNLRSDSGRIDDVTPRQLDVWCLIAAGETNNRIAEELFIAQPTVRVHVSALYDNLGLRYPHRNRATLTLMAIEADLVSVSDILRFQEQQVNS